MPRLTKNNSDDAIHPRDKSTGLSCYGTVICRACDQNQANERTRKQRLIILNNLGGECQCCHMQNIDLLSIDHIYGGGHQENKNISWKKYIRTLFHLPIENLRLKYRCLCYNCNYTLGFWGKCPHTLSSYAGETLLISNRGIKKDLLTKEEKKLWNNNVRKIIRIKHRLEMIQAYGGQCVNCGEAHPLFLTLDHINNNGAVETERGVGFYQYLKQIGYPGKNTQLQLLCHNCNALKEYVDNRRNKSEIIKSTIDIYQKQEYLISKETEEQLWLEARQLFAILNK